MTLRPRLLALMLTVPLVLGAQADTRRAEPLQSSPVQTTTTKLVYGLLSDSRYAYRPRRLDDALAQDIFKRYLESLDPGKVLFTRQDVDSLDQYRANLDESIKVGDVEPAYAIFKLYQTRMTERTAYARSLLKQDALFTFDRDERWHYDRKDVPWPANAQELDAVWKLSVRNDWLRLKLAGKQPDDIRKTLDKRYARDAANVAELDSEDVFQIFLNAYANSIDPHTDYFNPRAVERFNQSMSLSLEGIGAVLQKQDDIVVIREIVPGGPAALSNALKPGYRIMAVGQGKSGAMEDVVGWRIDDVVAKIKGPKGTQVRLDVIPPEAGVDSPPTRISITRDRVQLTEDAAKSKIIPIPAAGRQPAQRIGVITLPGFYQDFAGRRNGDDYTSATRDVAKLLEQFKTQNVDGVVLDLRNNGGGSLNEAVDLTGLFIDQGPVVQVRESGGRVSVSDDRKAGTTWDGPLAVLINRGSASASEIFAGAIQDYGRGLVIGESSFGKGTVQNMVDLDRWPQNKGSQFGQVKLTIAQFFLPGGSSTQNKGVVPDIAFPATVDASEFGESTYDNALPWSRIDPVEHVRYGDFKPILAQLTSRHEARMQDDLEYQWWLQDVDEFRAERAKKSISLNEAERRAERDKQEAKRQFRQAERKRLGMALDPLAEDAQDDGLSAGERDVVRDAQREKAAEDRPDPLLHAAAAILADANHLLNQDRQLAARVLPVSTKPGHWAD